MSEPGEGFFSRPSHLTGQAGGGRERFGQPARVFAAGLRGVGPSPTPAADNRGGCLDDISGVNTPCDQVFRDSHGQRDFTGVSATQNDDA